MRCEGVVGESTEYGDAEIRQQPGQLPPGGQAGAGQPTE